MPEGEKKSKIIVGIFIFAIIVSISFIYKRSFIDRDFLLVEEEAEEEAEAELEEVEESVLEE